MRRRAIWLDINTAPSSNFRCSCIGEAYSKKIVAAVPIGEERAGGQKIIPAATYAKIKDKIIAKQPKK